MNSAWPTFGGNNNRTGESPYDTSLVDGMPDWNFTTGGAIRASAVIDTNGTIYFGSTDNNEYFDRVRSGLCPANSSRIHRRVVEGADHDFLLPEHSRQLGEILDDWLNQCFNTCEKATFDEVGDCHPELPHA